MMGEKGIKGTLSVFLFICLDTWISDTSNLTDRDTEKVIFPYLWITCIMIPWIQSII